MSTFTPIDPAQGAQGNIVSTELFTAIAQNIAYLMDSMPVGAEIIVMTGFPNVPTPNPQIWQLCDGSLITNQSSPLRNQHTPNRATQALFQKATQPGEAGLVGGTTIKDFTHAHSGQTGVFNPTSNELDDEDIFNEGIPHAHGIYQDLGPRNVEPYHIRLNHYVKIL